MPVSQDYIEQVFASCLKHDSSRMAASSAWLNAISVKQVAFDEATCIAALACVKEVELVATYVRNENSEQQQAASVQTRSAQDANQFSINYGSTLDQVTQINVPYLHQKGFFGQGITILVLDSGFRTTHDIFISLRVKGTFDFVKNDTNVDKEPDDDAKTIDHGTQCLGLISGYKPGTVRCELLFISCLVCWFGIQESVLAWKD